MTIKGSVKREKKEAVLDSEMMDALRCFVGSVWLMRKVQRVTLATPEKMKLMRKREKIVDFYLKVLVQKSKK